MTKRRIATEIQDAGPLVLRKLRGEVVAATGQIKDANDEIAAPYRVVDVLDRLLAEGLIDDHEFRAGREFQDDFDKACLNGQRSVDLSRPFVQSGFREAVLAVNAERARSRIGDLVRLMGGHGSACASICWAVLGERRSLREFSDMTRLGGVRPISAKAASGLMIGALGVLAVAYGHKRA